MNDYDDLDDYSLVNSFRARSNTWPLNRPDFAVPSSGANIDETLPEIELEEDDLFTTNENWSTGVVDHDIMSWDPILNAQNQQQQATNQPSTVHHHHHQQQRHLTQQQLQPHPQPRTQAQHQAQQLNQQLPPQPQGHQRQQSIHIQNHHHQQPQSNHHQHHNHRHQDPQHLHHHHNHRSEQHHHHHHQTTQQNDSFHDVSNPTTVAIATQSAAQIQQAQPQLQHQTSPQPPPAPQQQHVQQPTLNSVHCLDTEDSNEYHLQQLHNLHLDNNPLPPISDAQQDHFAPALTSMCMHNPATSLRNDGYNISPNQNHHLQPLASARYDIDQHIGDYDLKAQHGDTTEHHLNQQPHIQEQQLIHQQHHQHHRVHPHHVISSSLDHHTGGSHVLSSSLGTSGIELSGELEDLDYKQSVDGASLLPNSHYDEQQSRLQDLQQQPEIQQQQHSDDSVNTDTQQRSDPNSTSKTSKQNVPRRNAWGNMSYADLISQAINSTSDKRLTLSQIYDWMVQHVPYFKDKGDSNSSAGWKNSVRHNLSLHSRFKRLQNEGTGKSSWWTINPEANIGKCARRRAASMEASKYEKKRGRAKKKADAIRQGLVSYPSLTNSSLNGSTSALDQQSQAQSLSQFHSTLQQTDQQSEQPQQTQPQPQLQSLDQFANQQQHQPQPTQQPVHRQPLQIQTLDHYVIDQPSQQQQQHLQQLQQSDARSCEDLNDANGQHDQNLFLVASQQEQPRYGQTNENSKIQQQQQSQYYYQFELSTAL